MKTYTITLPADVAHVLEVRAAIDDDRPEQGIQKLLCHLVENWRVA